MTDPSLNKKTTWKKARRAASFCCRVAFSGGILWWVLSGLDTSSTGSLLKNASLSLIALSILFYIAQCVLNGFRLAWILKAWGNEVRTVSVVRVHLGAFFYNLFSPGTLVGDIARVAQITDRQRERVVTTAHATTVWRTTGWLSLSLLASAGGAVLYLQYPVKRLLTLPACFIAMAFALLSLMILPRLIPTGRLKDNLPGRLLKSLDHGARQMQIRILMVTTSWAFCGHLLIVLSWWSAGLALGLHIPFAALLAVVPLASLFQMLPVSLQGLGFREAATVYLFSLIGIDKESSVSLAILVSTELLIVGVLAGLLKLGEYVYFSGMMGAKPAGHKDLPEEPA